MTYFYAVVPASGLPSCDPALRAQKSATLPPISVRPTTTRIVTAPRGAGERGTSITAMQRPVERRTFLTRSVAGLGVAATLGAAESPLPTGQPHRPPIEPGHPIGYTLTWLGVNGWQIEFDGTTVLVDPWVTRYFTGTFSPGGQDPDTEISWNRTLIDEQFTRPVDIILLTHGHFDHISDIPLIAAGTAATVWGTESHLNLVRSLAARTNTTIDENKLSLLRGGEFRDFGDYSIEVLRSVHRPFGKNLVAGTAQSCWHVDPSISSIKELGEGGSLNYVISNTSGGSLMILGSSDFSVSDLPTDAPDAVVFPTGGAGVAATVRRFSELVGQPQIVIASHWDNFDLPLHPPVDVGNVPALQAAVNDIMPAARFVIPEPNTPIAV